QLRRARQRQEVAARVAVVAHADVAHRVDHALHGKNAVGGDQVFEELGVRRSGRCRPLLRERRRRPQGGGETQAQEPRSELHHRPPSVLQSAWPGRAARMPARRASATASRSKLMKTSPPNLAPSKAMTPSAKSPPAWRKRKPASAAARSTATPLLSI